MQRDHHENVVSNLPLGVRFYYSDVATSGYVPFHWHASLEVLYVFHGQLTLNIDQKKVIVRDGQFVIISSGSIHDVENTPNQALVLQIPLQILMPYIDNPEDIYFDLDKQLPTKCYQAITDCLLTIYHLIDQQPAGYLFDAEAALMTFLKLVILNLGIQGKNRYRNLISLKSIIIYINDHYQDEISVNQLAHLAGYNPSYLSRRFKQKMGITLTEYIYEVRLSKFYDDLIHTDLPINELMDRHGLTNRRTSREMFIKMYGKRPLEIRKGAQEKA